MLFEHPPSRAITIGTVANHLRYLTARVPARLFYQCQRIGAIRSVTRQHACRRYHPTLRIYRYRSLVPGELPARTLSPVPHLWVGNRWNPILRHALFHLMVEILERNALGGLELFGARLVLL